eukprot:CAMPEP_0118981434 /NCGR_PEP_ID=MMETSP1173-20130426/30555_1 /TAXON_ID=1034831 /ORGANISM="Rhizochromulina marina cf, Strain CCMP1243" /LENGTH=1157 /DNA_ID=CAMNT_0006931847 /DNA_START=1 /DNA_END=3474 /DNA_ORIENTATION=+
MAPGRALALKPTAAKPSPNGKSSRIGGAAQAPREGTDASASAAGQRQGPEAPQDMTSPSSGGSQRWGRKKDSMVLPRDLSVDPATGQRLSRVFGSLRKSSEDEYFGSLVEARQLQGALRGLGVHLILHEEDFEDLRLDTQNQALLTAMQSCDALLVFGCYHYGEQTTTGREVKLWEKHFTDKPVVLLRMLSRTEDYKNIIARRLFTSPRPTLFWLQGSPMPRSLPTEVADALEALVGRNSYSQSEGPVARNSASAPRRRSSRIDPSAGARTTPPPRLSATRKVVAAAEAAARNSAADHHGTNGSPKRSRPASPSRSRSTSSPTVSRPRARSSGGKKSVDRDQDEEKKADSADRHRRSQSLVSLAVPTATAIVDAAPASSPIKPRRAGSVSKSQAVRPVPSPRMSSRKTTSSLSAAGTSGDSAQRRRSKAQGGSPGRTPRRPSSGGGQVTRRPSRSLDSRVRGSGAVDAATSPPAITRAASHRALQRSPSGHRHPSAGARASPNEGAPSPRGSKASLLPRRSGTPPTTGDASNTPRRRSASQGKKTAAAVAAAGGGARQPPLSQGLVPGSPLDRPSTASTASSSMSGKARLSSTISFHIPRSSSRGSQRKHRRNLSLSADNTLSQRAAAPTASSKDQQHQQQLQLQKQQQQLIPSPISLTSARSTTSILSSSGAARAKSGSSPRASSRRPLSFGSTMRGKNLRNLSSPDLQPTPLRQRTASSPTASAAKAFFSTTQVGGTLAAIDGRESATDSPDQARPGVPRTPSRTSTVFTAETPLVGSRQGSDRRLTASLSPSRSASPTILGLTVEDQLKEARDLRASGNSGKARQLYDAIIDHQTKALGPHHSATLKAKMSLATLLSEQGDMDTARDMCEKIIEQRAKHPSGGRANKDTLSAQLSLAVLLAEQRSDLDQAYSLLQTVVDGYSDVLGPEHQETLRAKMNLALVLKFQDKFGEARVLYEAAIKGFTRVLGAESEDTLTATMDFGILLAEQGAIVPATKHLRTAAEGRKVRLGPDHSDTLVAKLNLANVLAQSSPVENLEEARALYQSVVAGRTTLHGDRNASTLDARSNLALLLGRAGMMAEASLEYDEVIDKYTQVQGANHPDTLRATAQRIALRNHMVQGDADDEDEPVTEEGAWGPRGGPGGERSVRHAPAKS